MTFIMPARMKIAILADIHSNYPALLVVAEHINRWKPDVVVMAGDLVHRGPSPLQCLRLIEEKWRSAGWLLVRGNHEDYVLNHTLIDAPYEGPEFELFRSSFWTYQQLGAATKTLELMPFQISFTGPDGREVRVVHASMAGNRDGIYPQTTDAELRPMIAPPPGLFGTGHTHIPLVRTLGQTLIVNAGSVGMPFDGDPRASYAQVTWRPSGWQAEIVRLDYDRLETERAYTESGYLGQGGALVALFMLELRLARPHLNRWLRRYEQAILSGRQTVADAVGTYIRSLD